MAAGEDRPISPEDLERAVRSVAAHFSTDTVYIIGSQALLVGRNDIARALRFSHEIDVYPANREEWEAQNQVWRLQKQSTACSGKALSSMKRSAFSSTGSTRPPQNFLLTGAIAVTQVFKGAAGDPIKAVAPAPADVVAAKLVRGDDKE